MTRPPTPARFSRRYSALPFASMSPMKRARKRDQIGWLTFGPAADPVTGGESLTGTLAIVPLSRIQARIVRRARRSRACGRRVSGRRPRDRRLAPAGAAGEVDERGEVL